MGFERSQINQILTLLGVLYGAELPAMPCSPNKCRAAPKVHRRGVVTRGLAMRFVTIFLLSGDIGIHTGHFSLVLFRLGCSPLK